MSWKQILYWITQLVSFLVYVLATIVLIALLVVRIYQWRYQDRIYPEITVWGLDLSGLGSYEAMTLLDHQFNPYQENQLTLRHGQQSWQISPSDLGVSADAAATAVAAHAVGRGGSLWDNLQEQAQALRRGHEVEPILNFDTGVAVVFLS